MKQKLSLRRMRQHPDLGLTPDGRTAWDLRPYAFLADEKAPPTVNPSLWRMARLNYEHGLYKVTDGYAPGTEGGLLWSDPALGIDWPVTTGAATVNARDAAWPTLADLHSPFTYGADA